MNTCRCGKRWTGQKVAHCAARDCHRTFSTPALFDRHRRGGECLSPLDLGGMEFRDGMWRGPERPRDTIPGATEEATDPAGGERG